MTERFRDAEACGQCHLVDDTASALHDATGANVSPVLLWRSSLMGLAARDPYYLAVFSEELARAPSQRDAIEPLCSRCHAPAGSEELASSGGHLTFDQLVAGTDTAALLGRGGVTCSLCHQIQAANLGDESSFSGGFQVGYGRTMFGRYPDPMTTPMMLIVNYTPALGTQIEQSELCATCHTVLVPAATGQVVEQATFLEWRASSFPAQSKPCQTCHVPITDDQSNAIQTAVSGFPSTLGVRQPVGRHVFVGGNSYVLSLIGDAIDWAGAAIPASELTASAARDDAHLKTAAKLTVMDAHREGDTAVITIHVANQTGHKLPTGYPARRMWLHVTASAGSQTVFESGGTDATGAIVDTHGKPLALQPHADVVDSGDHAQIWESVLVDAGGRPTHRALDAVGYGKDDRILPAGFAPTSLDRTRTLPVGTDGDTSFVPGSDDVTFRIAGAPANVAISIDLCYEALRPDIIDAIDAAAIPAGERFVELARARAVTPVVMAGTTANLP